ncbi:hypothetical protein VXQ18_07725 [Brucella abortus]|nr:hypothetical protein [Brucella abortus]
MKKRAKEDDQKDATRHFKLDSEKERMLGLYVTFTRAGILHERRNAKAILRLAIATLLPKATRHETSTAMNYRHAYHAGNFADVVKHVILTRIAE